MTPEQFSALLEAHTGRFYQSAEFWIASVIGLAGLIFSAFAFWEARKAKKAAWEAGKTVKIQTITIELTEIAQRLDRLDFGLGFADARDSLNEFSRRLRRLIAPFASEDNFRDVAKRLILALDAGKQALEEIRPLDNKIEKLPSNAVYFAVQGHFMNINNAVAELMGLFEKRTISGESS